MKYPVGVQRTSKANWCCTYEYNGYQIGKVKDFSLDRSRLWQAYPLHGEVQIFSQLVDAVWYLWEQFRNV